MTKLIDFYHVQKAADYVYAIYVTRTSQDEDGTYVSFRKEVISILKEWYGNPNYTSVAGNPSFTSAVAHVVYHSYRRNHPLAPPPYLDSAPGWAVAYIKDYAQFLETQSKTQPEATKEIQMTIKNATLIEKRTFINGVDASTMSDDDIFQVIAKAESEAQNLETILDKPEKLIKKIAGMCKAIAKVKQYVDNR